MGFEHERARWAKQRVRKGRKQGVSGVRDCDHDRDDYVFEWAMKNPIPATKKKTTRKGGFLTSPSNFRLSD